jgi:hypothetical protein
MLCLNLNVLKQYFKIPKDNITVQEYHSLILLLSYDFPVECVANSLK